jgi:hypothetical protein
MQCLHFRDNADLDGDIYYKVRPIFDIVNRGRSLFEGYEDGVYSVDEVMIPYYGKHSTRQFIRGKPVRYGYKVTICLFRRLYDRLMIVVFLRSGRSAVQMAVASPLSRTVGGARG